MEHRVYYYVCVVFSRASKERCGTGSEEEREATAVPYMSFLA